MKWSPLWVPLSLFVSADIFLLQAADVDAGTTEVAAYGGLVAGIGTHGTVGGSVGYATTRRLLVLGEFSYIPAGSQELAGADFAVKASARAYDFNGGFHLQLLSPDRKAVPYAAVGVGAVHGSGSGEVTAMGQTLSAKVSNTDFYCNLGGGLRYYLSDRWGIRPELKIFAGAGTFARLTIGVFYQFGR